MRKLLTYLLLYCLTQANAWSQVETVQLPESSGESVVLHCDRQIYGLNEEIYFNASYSAPKELKSNSWSSVLYVELISWDGTKQASSKVPIKQEKAMGKILVPENIPSGVYYLRAYTLWMRNYSPVTYAYVPLKILNPYSQEILAGPPAERSNPWSMEHTYSEIQAGIVTSGLNDQYACRDLVEFDIHISEELRGLPYSLGIAKTPGQSSAEYTLEVIREVNQGNRKLEFLPEINGLTLSGTVVDDISKKPVPATRMQVSSYSNPFLYAEILSRGDGTFLFALPHFSGNPELHISEASDSRLDHKILLTSEFCNKAVHLPYVPLLFDSIEKSMVGEILLNTQLRDRYRKKTKKMDLSDSELPSFYGSGVSVTYVKDYIELSSLREFIYEIIPLVSIQDDSKGEAYVSIQGPSCMEIYPPLVLMDNVPVPNNEELLNIPSARIERIEALNQAYMVGNNRYSGILSIFSAKKDLGGLAQEGARHFFNFQMLDNPIAIHEHLPASQSSSPDIRNLLYWDPGIKVPEEGVLRVNFRTPDIPGQYVLTLRGWDREKGTEVLEQRVILVK